MDRPLWRSVSLLALHHPSDHMKVAVRHSPSKTPLCLIRSQSGISSPITCGTTPVAVIERLGSGVTYSNIWLYGTNQFWSCQGDLSWLYLTKPITQGPRHMLLHIATNCYVSNDHWTKLTFVTSWLFCCRLEHLVMSLARIRPHTHTYMSFSFLRLRPQNYTTLQPISHTDYISTVLDAYRGFFFLWEILFR